MEHRYQVRTKNQENLDGSSVQLEAKNLAHS